MLPAVEYTCAFQTTAWSICIRLDLPGQSHVWLHLFVTCRRSLPNQRLLCAFIRVQVDIQCSRGRKFWGFVRLHQDIRFDLEICGCCLGLTCVRANLYDSFLVFWSPTRLSVPIDWGLHLTILTQSCYDRSNTRSGFSSCLVSLPVFPRDAHNRLIPIPTDVFAYDYRFLLPDWVSSLLHCEVLTLNRNSPISQAVLLFPLNDRQTGLLRFSSFLITYFAQFLVFLLYNSPLVYGNF